MTPLIFIFLLTGVEGTKDECLELSSWEWEDEQSDETSLDGKEDALTVGAEGEVAAEAVGAGEGDGNQLQEHTRETDSFRTSTGSNLENLQKYSHCHCSVTNIQTWGNLTKLDPTTIPSPRVLETALLTQTMSEKLSLTTRVSKHWGVIRPR